MKILLFIFAFIPMIVFGQSKIRNTQITSGSQPSGVFLGADGSTNSVWITVVTDSINNGVLTRAPSQNAVFDNFVKYRLLTNHDSLSMLDEKSYNSLTDKPDMSEFYKDRYEIIVTSSDEATYTVPFVLKEKTMIFYNGNLLRSSVWMGIGTSSLTIDGNIRIKDVITVQN